MLGVNKVVLLGWIGQDPELRYTAAQRPVVTVRMATNRQIYDADGEKKKIVDWHTVIFNDQLAEFCAQKLSKGSKVFIEGMLEYHQRIHREFKAVKWMDALVVAQQLQIIDGMLVHEYPEDFPELAGYEKKKYNKSKAPTSKKETTKKKSTTQENTTQKKQQNSSSTKGEEEVTKDLFK